MCDPALMSKSVFLSFFFFLISFFVATAQDTLFFRDGTYSVARVTQITFSRLKFIQFAESGDSAERSEKASGLDSVIFKGGRIFRKGFSEDLDLIPADWRRFASYWDGRKSGEVKTSFPRSYIAANFLAGLAVIGLPYTLYKSFRKPDLRELPTREARRYRDDKDFARGFRKGFNRTNTQAAVPVFCAGLLTTILGFSMIPERHSNLNEDP